MIVQSFKYAKMHRIVHFNTVNFILSKFHVNSKIEKESIQEGRIHAICPLDWASWDLSLLWTLLFTILHWNGLF